MKTTLTHLSPVLLAILIICNSFTSANRNSIAKGSGIADGISFSFNAVKQKDGVVIGDIQWGNDSYSLACAKWCGNGGAILYTTTGLCFFVGDEGEGRSVTDRISEPMLGSCGDLLEASDFYFKHNVVIGNIQVKE